MSGFEIFDSAQTDRKLEHQKRVPVWRCCRGKRFGALALFHRCRFDADPILPPIALV